MRSTGASLNYAHHFHFGSQHFSLGLQSGVFIRSFDVNSIIVDNQIIGGIFDPDAPINESFLNQNKTYFTLSSGLAWRLEDRRGDEKLALDFAVNNLNEPDNSFLGTAPSRVPRNLSLNGSIFFLRRNDFFVEPNFRYINRQGFNYIFAGSWFHYQYLSRKTLQKNTQLSFGAWYNTNRALTLAFSYDQPKYYATFSYDIPTGSESNSWLGSGGIEFTLGIKFRSQIKDPQPDESILDSTTLVQPDTSLVAALDSLDEAIEEEPMLLADSLLILPTDTLASLTDSTDSSNPSVSDSLVSPIPGSDSISLIPPPSPEEDENSIVIEIPTRVEFSTKILEFGLGGMQITYPSQQTLDELSELLQLYPDTKIQIVGYTCDLGSPQENLRLS
ncbi:MAG: type IX secretion system membrane protein PorP/SprF, partial [Bacteroidota bacterium]